jgi:hypothetical protein
VPSRRRTCTTYLETSWLSRATIRSLFSEELLLLFLEEELLPSLELDAGLEEELLFFSEEELTLSLEEDSGTLLEDDFTEELLFGCDEELFAEEELSAEDDSGSELLLSILLEELLFTLEEDSGVTLDEDFSLEEDAGAPLDEELSDEELTTTLEEDSGWSGLRESISTTLST